ncbi:MAG: TonB family protein [Candidatus Omnitrophica bacterium]|nr:TonB family protein [Candidatus Omnitrophota bacterium]
MLFNDNVFKIALILSVSLHLFGISAGGFFYKRGLEDKQCEIEVTYLMLEMPEEEIKKEALEKIPQKYDLEEREIQEVTQKKPETIQEAKLTKDISEEGEQYLEKKELAELEEYIQYYKLIREKIKKHVTRNYTIFREEGRVDMAFTLTQHGSLKNMRIDETKSSKNPQLRKTALRSVKNASPFPPFPKELQKRELTFSIAIIFKKE